MKPKEHMEIYQLDSGYMVRITTSGMLGDEKSHAFVRIPDLCNFVALELKAKEEKGNKK